MAKASPIQEAFNGGEWSPLMEGRVRLDKRPHAVRKAFNFGLTAQGPLIRRSGTKFVAPQWDHANKSRLIEFQFSALDNFMLGFENQRVRVMNPDGLLLRPAVAVTALVSSSPAVFTVAGGHGLLVGDEVFLGGFAVTTALFQAFAQVTNVNVNDITLSGITVPGGFALSGGETLAEVFHVVTPYTVAKLPALRSVQSADTLYLFEGTARTQVLKRNSTYDWPIRDFKFEDGPYLSINDTATKLTPTSTGNAITAFNPANVASSGDSVGNEDEKAFDGDIFTKWLSSASQTGTVFVRYDFGAAVPLRGYVICGQSATNNADSRAKEQYNPGGWRIEGSANDIDWTVLDSQVDYTLYTRQRSVFFRFKTEPNFRYYRIFVTACVGSGNFGPAIAELRFVPAQSQASSSITFNASSVAGINRDAGFLSTDIGRVLRFKASDGYWRWYTITAVNSTTQIVARQESDALPDLVGTTEWRLGLFSDTTGWPTCGFFYEDRLIVGGGAQNPDLVAASAPGGYERFSPTDPDGVVTEANGWTITLNGRKVGAVRWIAGDSRGLVVGTLNGPFMIRAIDGKGSLTPANAFARPISGRTCADMEPVQIDNQILSVPISRRIVREISYDFNRDGYQSPSMSLFSSHVGTSRFLRMSYAQEPHSIVWLPREDGLLAGFTYNREEDVLSWHRHLIGGTDFLVEGSHYSFVEDCAALSSVDGTLDELWLTVSRTINGQTRRYYEIMQPFWDEASTLDTAWFVDCGFLYEGPPVTEISGLWKLEGATVSVLANGYKVAPQVVVNGSITLPFPGFRVVVGFGFESHGETLPSEAGAADGTAQGKTKRTHKATIRLWATVGGKIGPPDGLQDIIPTESTDEPANRIEPFTGDYLVDWPDGYDTANTIVFQQPAENPLPFNPVAIMPQLMTQDGR